MEQASAGAFCVIVEAGTDGMIFPASRLQRSFAELVVTQAVREGSTIVM